VYFGVRQLKKYLLAKEIMKPVTTVNTFTFIHYESNNRRNETLTEVARLADKL